ncbi:MAG: hypothetical protein WKF70_02175, partial [Chitinophagaceae bacterium]
YLQSGSEVQGYGIHQSYWVVAACFAYLAFFAFAVKGILRKQGIDYEKEGVIDNVSNNPEAGLKDADVTNR